MSKPGNHVVFVIICDAPLHMDCEDSCVENYLLFVIFMLLAEQGLGSCLILLFHWMACRDKGNTACCFQKVNKTIKRLH